MVLIVVYTGEDGKLQFDRFLYVMLAVFSSYFMSVFRYKKVEDKSQIPKTLTNAAFEQLQAFHMYGGLYSMSAPSLHS